MLHRVRETCPNMGTLGLSSKLSGIHIFGIFLLGFVAVVNVFIGLNN